MSLTFIYNLSQKGAYLTIFFLQDSDTSEESTDIPAEEILGDAPFHPQIKPTYVSRGLEGFYGGFRGGNQGCGGFRGDDRIGYHG